MKERQFYREYAVYRGCEVGWDSYESLLGHVLLYTADPDLARRLEFYEAHAAWCLELTLLEEEMERDWRRWVPAHAIEATIKEEWYGLLEGQQVCLESETETHYEVSSPHPVSGLHPCEETDFWVGSVPKSAVSRVWCETTRRSGQELWDERSEAQYQDSAIALRLRQLARCLSGLGRYRAWFPVWFHGWWFRIHADQKSKQAQRAARADYLRDLVTQLERELADDSFDAPVTRHRLLHTEALWHLHELTIYLQPYAALAHQLRLQGP